MSHQASHLPISADQSPVDAADAGGDDRRCCSFSRYAWVVTAVAAVLGIPAAYLAGKLDSAAPSTPAVQWHIPEIDATASATSEKYSVATGPVSEQAEGFFVLDHNSGLLQCNVLYPRVGRFLAQFNRSIAADMGTGGKGGQYIMVTGQADFPTSSNNPAGACVIYVLDTATGTYAAYGVPFNRVFMNANRQQNGELVLLHTNTANPLIDRSSVR